MAIDLTRLPGSTYHILGLYPRGKDYKESITNHCDSPWKVLTVDLEGNCFLCKCEAHLPLTVGNVLDFADLNEVWTNPTAQDLQQTITDRSYTFCAVQHCGVVNQEVFHKVHYISINIDESCNLACPSCRRELINHTSGERFEQKSKMVSHLVDLINKFDKPLHLTMSGNGDPLASLIMRPLVLNWQPKANQTIKLFTNGLLMRKLLPDSPILPYIKDFQISVDAGTQEVYEQVRRPGKFSVLEDNLQWLEDNKPTNSTVLLMFCLSANNVNDIVNFANLCSKYGFRGEITKVENWNTFDNFGEQDVMSNPDHPAYQTAVDQLKIVSEMPHIRVGSFLKNYYAFYKLS